jgi:signal peptidase I
MSAQDLRAVEQPAEETREKRTESGSGHGRPSFLKRHTKLVRRVFRIALVFALAIGAAVVLRIYVVQPFYIPSQSMEPTLHGCPTCNDDRVLVDKLSYRSGDVSTRDIVVFNRPSTWHVSDQVLVKRVIGLAGDVISIKSGFVYINGLRTVESYVNSKCGPHPTQPEGMRDPFKVPQGDVFVMGDNRCDSDDSRQNGPVPTSDIIGRAFMIIWPLNRIRFL